MKPKTKESASLLIVGALASACAWAFWHLVGDVGFTVLTMIAIVSLLLDNIRLRRKLRRYSGNTATRT